jgi:hypothetical protein
MIFNSISIRSPRTKTSSNNGANKNKNKRNRSKKTKTKLTGSIEKDVGGPPLTPIKTPIKTPTKRSTRSSLRIQTNSLMSSLGTGGLGQDGSVSFIPSPKAKSKIACRLFSPSNPATGISDHPICYDGIALEPTSTTSTVSSAKSHIIGRSCSFLRVSDLEMDDESMTTMSITSDSSNEPQEHSFRAVVNPPPGIEIDPKERWVALCTTFDDNSNGAPNSASMSPEHTPIAPLAMKRLANFGLTTTLNEVMWQPDSKSEKMFKKASGDNEWTKQTFSEGLKEASTCPESSSDVLIWTGSFKHGFYGSEVPAIRSAGVVDTSAKKLLELLVDSTRVKEYNKISLGRQDLVTFDGNLEEDGPFGKSITKVMRSESKPPLVSNLALTSILHAKKLPDGSGYLIVSRAVHRPEEESSLASSVKTEIVMGVNLIVDFDSSGDGGTERCLMVNVNHMYSPMIPMYIAKKLGLSTARKFIDDIRAIA